ncbi:uncharacterized protein LOC124461460 [Drosophila willistoni]|uniref:uncharacterized protein LOC124461460 n=1 Tax=Drosophila willistoni TaxID=7260 RepID=UPI001F077DE5|nr:uncharacterized protein LOC124461460 [Drosophila willistoni]
MLQHIQIPRLVVNDTDNIELHGFSGASTKAYAAVVYSRVINKDGSISTSIMAAKSRVAPLKQQSLPRLELCAALLLSQLIRSIKAALRHQKVTAFAWCDSTIVLYWLSYAPSRLKTFVGNRTSEILDTIPRHYWRHVDSKSNPADCASRGLMAADLKDFQLWWNDPSWIRDADQFLVRLNNSQVCLNISEKNIEKEAKSNCLTALVEAAPDHPLDHLVQRVSSWLTLVHTVGYVLRFLRCTKGPFGDKGSNCLTFEEITAARIVCLRHAQTCFQDDYQLLLANKPLRSRSQLAKLSPMIDKDGLLRVGGRLYHSQLSTEAKHPVLLPKSHRITKLILEYEHRVNLHPGVSSLFVMASHNYTRGRLRPHPRRLGYWQSIQSMMQGFWKQWHQEYLTTLQQRPKWTTTTPNIAVGDVVLVKESNTPPAHWHLALVLEAYPGKDQLVRAVRLKTSSGELTRPITKVAVLPRSETVFQGGPGCSGTDCVYR